MEIDEDGDAKQSEESEISNEDMGIQSESENFDDTDSEFGDME